MTTYNERRRNRSPQGRSATRVADASVACRPTPPAPVKAVAALARTVVAGSSVAVDGACAPLLPSASVPASVHTFHRIGMPLRDVTRQVTVVLHTLLSTGLPMSKLVQRGKAAQRSLEFSRDAAATSPPTLVLRRQGCLPTCPAASTKKAVGMLHVPERW